MIVSLSLLIAENTWSAALLSHRSLGIALWTGLAVLSIALLILMRTRWGQAQPLSKCIVLSVFAHLLLIMYASGTRLFVERPPGSGDEPIQLAFVTAEDAAAEQQREDTEREPWDELLSDQTLQPEAVDLSRAEPAAVDISRSTEMEDQDALGDVVPTDQMPDATPVRQNATPQAPLPDRPHRSPVSAAVMDPLPKKHAAAQESMMPEPIVPDRVATTSSPRRKADQGPENRLPSQLVDMGSRMQKLADIQPRSETGDSLPGELDQLEQSENRGSSAIESTGIVRPRSASDAPDFEPLVAIPTGVNPAITRAETTPSDLSDLPETMEQVVASVPRRLGDGQPLPPAYRLRNNPARDTLAVTLGGGTRAAAAVQAALAWLAAQQENDGRWDPDRWGAGIETHVAGEDRGGAGLQADTGITALAILAFLAKGENHLEGIYRKNVQHGLEFLLQSQAGDGNLAGDARFCSQMYCHGMASLALSEALAMTGDTRIKPYVQRAVDYSVAAQHASSGGWRYQPGDQGDMSQFGWQVMALKSAEAAGISLPQSTQDGMLHFLELCQKGEHGGLSGYRPGMPPSPSMTAEALACRYFIESSPTAAQVSEATAYLLEELPQAATPNYYYWYYGTLAMFQVQGDSWEQWNEAMQQQLVRRQRTDGHLAGSWDPDTVWGSYGGRIYSSAMATLCLEVYYRYLPLTSLRP